MRMRTLGGTGLEVSELSLGGIKFGGITEAEVVELVHAALDGGINFIDTARAYPNSEERIGAALAGRRREDVVLCSKSLARSAEGMRRDIETSLRLLKTDYLDIYLAHNLRKPEDYDRASGPGGAVEALEAAREEGLVRHIGLSCHRYRDTFERAILSGRFEVALVAYNVLNDELMDERVMPLAHEKGLGVIVMKALGGGVLGSMPEGLELPGGPITPGAAIQFVLANENVDCTLVGMQSVRELEENLAAVRDEGRMSPEKMEALRTAARALGKGFCRACGYCQPCPEGILIPVVLRHLYYAREHGLVDWSRGRYGMVEVKGDACKRCGRCAAKCPYDLPIPDLLHEAHEMLGDNK